MDADSVKLSKYNWHVDVTKSRKVLGLEPTPVEETIRKTVDWFKENDYLQ